MELFPGYDTEKYISKGVTTETHDDLIEDSQFSIGQIAAKRSSDEQTARKKLAELNRKLAI